MAEPATANATQRKHRDIAKRQQIDDLVDGLADVALAYLEINRCALHVALRRCELTQRGANLFKSGWDNKGATLDVTPVMSVLGRKRTVEALCLDAL
ncbi:MAG: hypothetical protein AAFZ49_00425 [Cyanobacteria bacterium J06659_2]